VKNAFRLLHRFAFTATAVVAALVVGNYLWVYYMDAPWTRDGRVRADVVVIAPDVSGFVTEILVRDNQQVRRGDVIFRIDQARFALALQQADAVVDGRKASLEQTTSDLKRYRGLTTDAVSQQKQEQVLAAQLQAKAAYDQAVADQAVAQLNLARSEVRAAVNGKISNMDLRPGTYVSAGKGVMALVDTDTLHIDGYFEETKLPRIHVGDRVDIRLMGNATRLAGHVESIAAGIEDRDRGAGTTLLANVNPTFSWVRLAQRVPVRISLDSIATDGTLVAGRTATVEILSQEPIGLTWLFGYARSDMQIQRSDSLRLDRLAGWLGRELHWLSRERTYTAAGFSSRPVHDRHFGEARMLIGLGSRRRSAS
jgi:multidrug resistance efflux pump